ncbi:thiamine-phosphate synthase [Anaerocolumna cellulosilytica]|uniref:Thiamine-phosphate synthase n=1 Tax=Anaerocolumna cellulosilytica TaxID=433286 RepID=A0A6S6QTW1_9FIRM|nr:thiamine phosphate synthase [Anaerocolumna cellulosilytica]MBB5197998.1 thiamine-phosphate pyrophosphorylase [Anaerocolumna cellulosilytica]BCJ93116.1 thiamine-phosphate synthase [Anaerocolumna cellulosilytica]
MKNNTDYSLYLVTDRQLMSTETLEEAVEQALLGGCKLIQLREKTATSREFYELACSIKRLTNRYQAKLIINDRIDIALAIDADGVHVGQNDLPGTLARKLIGTDKLLGISVSTIHEAVEAAACGADYLGIGAMYPTATKTDAKTVSMDELLEIRAALTLPLIVIGGINQSRVADFKNTGINGIAVVSSVISQKNIKKATIELKRLTNQL